MNSAPFQKLGKPSEEKVVAKFDILGNLPNEISYKILIPLTPQDIVNVFNCNKKWSRDMNYAYFWKSKLRLDYHLFEEKKENEFYSKFIKKFSSAWQGKYLYNFGLQFNFENNNIKRILACDASPRYANELLTFVHFDDRRLIFYRNNHMQINVVDSRTGRLEKVFRDSLTISSVIKHGNLLISITEPNIILKVWNIKTEKCLVDQCVGVINRHHKRPSLTLTACKHLIIIKSKIIGRENFQIHIFDMKTKTTRIMNGIIDVCCNNDIIATANINGTIQITNVNFDEFTTVDCLTSTGILSQIIINTNFLVTVSKEVGSEHSDAIVWDIGTKTNFIIPNKNRCKLISQNKLICMDSSSNWELWNLDSQNFHFKINDSNLKYITWNKSYIFTTSFNYNHVVKIWCFNTGRCLQSFRLPSSSQYSFMATEEKLVFANRSILYYKKEEIKISLNILDYQANIKNHLKEI